MTNPPASPRPLRTFADDIAKRERWLTGWFRLFAFLTALNVLLVVLDRFRAEPAPFGFSIFHIAIFGGLMVFFAVQRHQLNNFKTKHGDVVQILGDEGLPHVRYTTGMILRAISQGVTQIELSPAQPLEPLASDNGGPWLQSVSLADVVRRLKKLCGHTPTSTGPTFFKVNAMKKHCIVTCKFRDTDDYASITITPDNEPQLELPLNSPPKDTM